MELPEVAQSQFNSQGGKGLHDPSRSTRYDERTGGPDKITVQGLNSDTEVGQITMNQRPSLDGMPKINTNTNFLEVTRDDLQKETINMVSPKRRGSASNSERSYKGIDR